MSPPDDALGGYRDLEALYVGRRTIVSRATRTSDGAPVALKRVAAALPTVPDVSRQKREFDLARLCAGDGVVAMHGVYARDGAAWIEMALVPGASIEARVARGPLSVVQALEVTRRLAEILERVHGTGVVHNDVCPANVMLGDDGAVTLLDFGISSATPRQSPMPVARLEGTPAFMSPEQTGRMNRPLDWRSDTYSLGATLYFMLTGAPPFEGRDALEFIHAHIAKLPLDVRVRAPEVPEAVALIVATLLAKRPADRYQTSRGLISDLDRCLRPLREGAAPALFTPRADDLDDTLRLPDTLYGRADDLAAVDSVVGRVAAGATEAVFVTGTAGVGKTSFVGEIRRLASAQGALVLAGKFEQFRRDLPFSALLDALRAHLGGLRALDAAALQTRRDALRARLGELAPALAEVLPELSALVGPLERPRDLPPAESERRLVLALTALLSALPTSGQPLVLFLDDLQWADPSSAVFVSAAITDPSLRSTLILGAWRAEEMHEGHAVARALRAAAAVGARVTALDLAPLAEPEIYALLRDAFERDDDDLRALSTLLHGWTGGNPFLAHRALEGLRDLDLVRREQGVWRWRVGEIARRGLGTDAAGYVAGRIAELPPPTRRALEVAGCFTGAFRESDLAASMSLSRKEVRAHLAPALALRLLHPVEEDWWPDATDDVEFSLSFTHDRVREAASAHLGDDDARAIHRRVGERLRARGDADVFEVVHHLNLAAPLLDEAERVTLRRLDVEAGRKALRNGAFAVAHGLMEHAAALTREDDGSRERGERLAESLDAARAASFAGAHERVDAHLAAALRHATSVIERSAAMELRALDLAGRDVLGAIDVALDALRDLGVDVPRHPTMEDVQRALGDATGAVLSRPPEEVLSLPELSDPNAAAVLRLCNAIFAPSYLAAPLLMPMLASVIVRQTLAMGASPASTYGFAILSVVLTSVGMFDPGYKVASLSLRLMERFESRGADVRSAHVLWGFVMPFTRRIPEAVAAHRAYHPHAMASGDHEYAAWISHLSLANAFYAGTDLATLGADLEREAREMRRLGQQAPLDCTEPFVRLARALQGRTRALATFDDEAYSEDATLAALVASGSRGAVYVLQVQRMLLRLLARDPVGALAAAETGAPYADGASCTYHVVMFHEVSCLARAALAAEAPDAAERDAQLALALAHRDALSAAAAHAPHNHLHRVALLDAELARARGEALAAMDGYDAAVSAARTHGFALEEALAHELAARHQFSRGSVTAARAHLAAACVAWSRWGASAKVAALTEEFPELAPQRDAGRPTTLDLADAELDLATLSKATMAINAELRTDRLVARVLDVCMENAGATRGALLLQRDAALSVAVARGGAACPEGAPAAALGEVASRVVRYAAGAQEALVLSNALRDSRFGDGSAGELSALALPLTLNTRPVGVVYLENDLTSDAFTPGRAKLLGHLGAQAAIALENARLYAEAEAMARSAERFVPREFLSELGRSALPDVAPGDARELEMSVLFADLRGFTGLTERLGPRATFALLNGWLERATDAVRRHGGFVKDIIGDGTLALFSAEPDRALRAALEIAAIPEALRADGVTEHTLRVGVGLDRGPVTLGTLGSEKRLAIAVVGDTVNAASRLESATKGLSTRALLSARFVSALRSPGSFALRSLGAVSLHGRASPLSVYESLDAFAPPARAAMLADAPTLARALGAMRAGDQVGAAALLEECVRRCPDDALAAGLLDRVRSGARGQGKDDVELC